MPNWTAGFEQENGSGKTVFAEHVNHIVMAARGNYVVDPSSGQSAVTENSSPNKIIRRREYSLTQKKNHRFASLLIISLPF